jgi:MinD superfamily P-loop ATPase
MIRIAVASGKGGTGKTTVATSLALLLARTRSVHFLDCDVEAPNGALFLRPTIDATEHVKVTRPVPVVDETVCDHCGDCSAFCRFHALGATARRVLVFPEICHGCGGCVLVCQKGAISETPRCVGQIAEGSAGTIRFTQGMLNTGETATVHLIRAVRRRESAAEVVIVDSPPGTSCPVVAAVDGIDWVILVTEPTPFGLNDLSLAVEMTARLRLRTAVVINRDGPGDDRIDRFCASAGIPVIGRIADDRRVAEAYSRGELPLALLPSFRVEIEAIAGHLCAEVLA